MRVVSKTHVGMVRENNEDALLEQFPKIFAVADGMGGYAAGEIASHSGLKAFATATHQLRKPQALQLSEKAVKEILLAACIKANEHVYKMAQNNAAYREMGSTLTALYLPGDDTAYVLQVGDSRLYLFRDGLLSCVTHDQSIVGYLLQHGKISPREAMKHPQRNVLLQAIGVAENLQPEIIHFALEKNDKLLLCSDGLTDMLTDSEIAELLNDNDTEVVAEKLLEKALDNGGKDNISLILLTEIGKSFCGGQEI